VDLIQHPTQAALAQFIVEIESTAPGSERVVTDLIEALYEFGTGSKSMSSVNGPMVLLTAHRAKGLEFDHVLILDGDGWGDRRDEERRLFYVAMTRARKTLTICEQVKGAHSFTKYLNAISLRSRPEVPVVTNGLGNRIWIADPEQVVLSWPGYFGPKAPIHKAINHLNYGDSLLLRHRSDGNPGWELADGEGTVVTRMAKRFTPPEGKIVSVRVGCILTRIAKGSEIEQTKIPEWELILPEIEYSPAILQADRQLCH